MANYINKPLPDGQRMWQIGVNKKGEKMQIIYYQSYSKISVRFLDEHKYIADTSYHNFLTGAVKNKYRPVYGEHGYMGEGKYSTLYNKNSRIAFEMWSGLHERSGNFDGRHPAYADVSVDENWYNFQNFHKWFDENYYEIEGEVMSLDKDILYPGNRVYSPDKCIIIPLKINDVFITGNQTEDSKKLPVGISKRINPKSVTYRATVMSVNDENIRQIFQKVFKTIDEAMIYYIEHKIKMINFIANKYKDKLPIEIYNAIINYRDPEWEKYYKF